ncbi:MAG: hypothetical protein R3D66_04945 [Alphaproteobacteria bacterium]
MTGLSRFRFWVGALLLWCLLFPQSAGAQEVGGFILRQRGGADMPPVPLPSPDGAGIESLEDVLAYKPLPEPNMPQVKFLEIPRPPTVQGRIDELLHGIVIDVPPEYDHYGYEMRRYMAHVAGPEVLGDPARIKAELKNIRAAKIILRYWRKKLDEEIGALETEIAADPSLSRQYSQLFKYNRGVSRAFMAECGSWIENNENLLAYLLEIGPNAYSYKDPILSFKDMQYHMKFKSLYDARGRALTEIQDYTPFRVMIY